MGLFVMPCAGKLLRIFLDENDRLEGKPLFMSIVAMLHANGLNGATVLKGIEGYGAHRVLHTARNVDFGINLPVVIEVIDSEERIADILPRLREMISEGLITLENVQMIALRKEGA
jgi:PII-like signaling protein